MSGPVNGSCSTVTAKPSAISGCANYVEPMRAMPPRWSAQYQQI